MSVRGFTHLTSAAISDIGRRRRANEDAVLILPRHAVFCVADGMGGAEAGDLASRTTVEHIERIFTDIDSREFASAALKGVMVRRAITYAGRWIWANAREKGMRSCGTTAVVLVFDSDNPDIAVALHVGDSRLYRFRAGELLQLTRDHSLAAAVGLADEKLLPPGSSEIITRAVGVCEEVALEETHVDVLAGDVFLLCSDGLSKMIDGGEIARVLAATPEQDPSRVVAQLADRANAAGGYDNVSVVLVRVGRSAPAAGPEDSPAASGRADTRNATTPETQVRHAGTTVRRKRPMRDRLLSHIKTAAIVVAVAAALAALLAALMLLTGRLPGF